MEPSIKLANNLLKNARAYEVEILLSKLEKQGGHFYFPKSAEPKIVFRPDRHDCGYSYILEGDDDTCYWPVTEVEIIDSENYSGTDINIFVRNTNKNSKNFSRVACICEDEVLPGEILRIAVAIPDVRISTKKHKKLWERFKGSWDYDGTEKVIIDAQKEEIFRGSTMEPISVGMNAWKDIMKIKGYSDSGMTDAEAVRKYAQTIGIDLPF